MRAMQLSEITDLAHHFTPLELINLPVPEPAPGEVLLKIHVCGVCHTELDEIEGRTPPPKFPVIPGHQVVGNIIKRGKAVSKFKIGERVGVAWIFSSCGKCNYCLEGNDNLCTDDL